MDPVIISTGGIMNKLEGCYLLVLVNTEITERPSQKESIIHTFSSSIFSRILFPKSKPTSKCIEFLYQKNSAYADQKCLSRYSFTFLFP